MKTLRNRIQLPLTMWLASALFASATPTITSFSPGTGAPGTQVTINGNGFLGTQTLVQFGSDYAAVTFTNNTQIVATVPTNAVSAPITVQVTGVGGGIRTTPTNFWVAPRIDSFDASAAKGQNINLFGANFIVGGTAVYFGGVPATSGSVPATTQITVTVPTNAVTGPLTVATFAGTNISTTNFVVAGAGPSITDFSPSNGPVGQVVVINGGNFAGLTNVTFNGARSPAIAITAFTQIHAQVPTNATTGPIVVFTTTGMATSPAPFVVTGLAPVITSFDKANGKSGDLVTIHGVNFLQVTNVKFNGTNANFSIPADTQITTQVPGGATTGPITVRNAAGAFTTTSNFSVGPRITAFNPGAGDPGTAITIDGDNLGSVTNVAFNGSNAFFSFTGLNQINAFVPLDARTGPIRVDATGGSDVTTNHFLVTGVAPVITNFTPTSGIVGVQSVTIQGVNFTFVTNVSFGGASVGVTPPSDTTFAVTVPNGAVTGPITVRSPYGTNTSVALFYISPQLTDFTPKIGLPASKVTLFGANFLGASDVKFVGSNAPPSATFNVLSANQMECFVPLDAVNGAITVFAPAGPITSTNTFAVQHTGPLSIAAAPTNRYLIRWSSTLTNYRLEATTNLAAPIVWTNTAYPTLSNAGQFYVSNAVTDSPKFFRIINP